MAKDFPEYTFAVADEEDFATEVKDLGLSESGEEVNAAILDEGGRKFAMEPDDFDANALRSFVTAFKKGEPARPPSPYPLVPRSLAQGFLLDLKDRRRGMENPCLLPFLVLFSSFFSFFIFFLFFLSFFFSFFLSFFFIVERKHILEVSRSLILKIFKVQQAFGSRSVLCAWETCFGIKQRECLSDLVRAHGPGSSALAAGGQTISFFLCLWHLLS